MGRTLSDVPGLIKQRKPFKIASMSAVNHYPDGAWRAPDGGWNTVIFPEQGALYVVSSFWTPIAWIDQYGQAVRTEQHFSSRTSRHQGLMWYLADDEKLRGTKREREAAKRRIREAHQKYHLDKAEEQRERKNAAARDRRAQLRHQREQERQYAIQREQERLALERESALAIQSILTGPPEVVLLGVDGEREAIESIVSRDATRVTHIASHA